MFNIKSEPGRYIINGIFATIVHFSILSFIIEVLNVTHAGTANFIAAIFGITTSFLGSRYYVFRKNSQSIYIQATKFWLLYSIMAITHGVILYVWTDIAGYDYRIGFLIATGLQVMVSYFGNKILVFK